MDVIAWLNAIGLGKYAESFRANAVDGEVLPSLTAEDLRDLGVTAVGDRRKLLDAIAALRSDGIPKAPVETAEAAAPFAEGERREVAVLFADLVGSTALAAELGAEEMHGLLQRYFAVMDKIVDGHGGRVDKHIGDAVMGVFGAPVAHDNDIERAARAALAMHAAMADLSRELGRKLRAHVAVASGDVLASDTGSTTHREYTVTGDAVNLAARLLDAAAPEETVVSETVRRALAARAEFADAGVRSFKGFARPEPTWKLIRVQASAAADRPFVGRLSELGLLDAALTACATHGHGQCIYIRGDAGIGKSRLCDEVGRHAFDLGFAVHRVQAMNYGSGGGRDPIRTLARRMIGLEGEADATAAAAAAAATIAAGFLAEDKAVFLIDLTGAAQTAETAGLLEAMDLRTREDGRRRALIELLTALSAQRPRTLMVEDVHACDGTALSYLAALAETAADCPAVVMLTSRPEGDPMSEQLRAQLVGVTVSTIELGPLRREEAMALVEKLGTAKDAAALVERANGNPLFLEQLLQGMSEAALTDIPSTVRSVILSRIDGLDPGDRRAIQAASVLGERFSASALLQVLGDPTYNWSTLVRHRLLRSDGGDLVFSHGLIREGVVSSLLKVRRQELHRRAAVCFAGRDPIVFAEHLDQAGAPEAAAAYLDAARQQAASYRDRRALTLVERALKLTQLATELYALTSLQGQLLLSLGRVPAAQEAFERAFAAAADDRERCDARIGVVQCMRIADRLQEAFGVLDEAEALARGSGLKEQLSRILHLRGNLYFPLGEVDNCQRSHEEALKYALEVGSPELEANALSGLGDAEYARGHFAQSHEYFRRCVELARRHGLQRVEAANLAMMAITVVGEEIRPVLQASIAALEAALRVGHRRAAMTARSEVCFCLVELGEYEDAHRQIDALLEEARAVGARRFEVQGLGSLGQLYLVEGKRAEAAATLRTALGLASGGMFAFAGAFILGALAFATDDPEERQQLLAKGEAVVAAGTINQIQFFFYRFAIEAALDDGDFDRAERYCDALEVTDNRQPLPWEGITIQRGRALVAYGRGRRDQDLLAEMTRLREAGLRLGTVAAIRAIEEALAAPGWEARPLTA